MPHSPRYEVACSEAKTVALLTETHNSDTDCAVIKMRFIEVIESHLHQFAREKHLTIKRLIENQS